MSKISNKSNKELMEYQQKLKEDYELVRSQMIKFYDHWENIREEYDKVVNELNNRYGINKNG